MSMPVARVKCVGLNSPSTPNVWCHQKSAGPATSAIPEPIINSLNAVAKDFARSSLFVNNKMAPITAAIDTMPTPV